MTDRDALLAAVLREPDEDTPRLMYADEIQDAEPERAEFIRVQVELARLGVAECPGCVWNRRALTAVRMPCACRPPARELRARLQELTGAGFALWGDDLPPSVTHALVNAGAEFEYRRGFVESVTCTADAWLKYGDEIVACQPVRTVRPLGFLPSDMFAALKFEPNGSAATWDRFPGVRFLLSSQSFIHPTDLAGALSAPPEIEAFPAGSLLTLPNPPEAPE